MQTSPLEIPAATPSAPVRAAGGAMSLPAPAERGRLNLSWLVQLHWWAILGHAIVVVVAETWGDFGLPSTALATLLFLEIVGNVVLGGWAKRARVTDVSVAVVMLVDAVVLTVLLDLTGGASNPFATLYLVNVALAAVLLPPRWSWTVSVAGLAAFASLFVHEAIFGQHHHIRGSFANQDLMSARLRGMWIAFSLAAAFIVFFVQRVGRALAARERELQQTRALGERREKLASLATLAAGAAHELSTPLSTIAVVAKELQRSLADSVPQEVRADLELVRDQVARCRDILDRMAAHAGENVGEPFARMSVRDWLAYTLEGFPARGRVVVRVQPLAEKVEIFGPARALSDALRGLVKNAVQASRPDATVTLRITAGHGRVRAAVLDRGPGMAPDVLARVGEPFFTTKGPGEGMGLGLFLTRALAEQLGGEFHIASRAGAGTEAFIELPAVPAGEGGAS